ncbi:MAG: hypothetical protein IPL79_06085 [Myxococcales bacterium]|nr:hypothetical protein [Myxococcales bacterium]
MSSAAETVSVKLSTSQLRHGISALVGLALGAFLVIKTNTLGQWAGYGLLAWGAYHAVWWIYTTATGAAALVVGPAQTQLPARSSRGPQATLPTSSLTAAYLLRHASPWNKAAPTLVIETGERAYLYPRDWFAGEADQRRIIDAIASHTGGAQDSAS